MEAPPPPLLPQSVGPSLPHSSLLRGRELSLTRSRWSQLSVIALAQAGILEEADSDESRESRGKNTKELRKEWASQSTPLRDNGQAGITQPTRGNKGLDVHQISPTSLSWCLESPLLRTKRKRNLRSFSGILGSEKRGEAGASGPQIFRGGQLPWQDPQRPHSLASPFLSSIMSSRSPSVPSFPQAGHADDLGVTLPALTGLSHQPEPAKSSSRATLLLQADFLAALGPPELSSQDQNKSLKGGTLVTVHVSVPCPEAPAGSLVHLRAPPQSEHLRERPSQRVSKGQSIIVSDGYIFISAFLIAVEYTKHKMYHFNHGKRAVRRRQVHSRRCATIMRHNVSRTFSSSQNKFSPH